MSNHIAKKRYFDDIESNFDYIPLDPPDARGPSDPRVRPARALETKVSKSGALCAGTKVSKSEDLRLSASHEGDAGTKVSKLESLRLAASHERDARTEVSKLGALCEGTEFSKLGALREGTEFSDRTQQEKVDTAFSQNLGELCSVNKMIFSSFQKIGMLEEIIATLTRRNGDLEKNIVELARENEELKTTNRNLKTDLANETQYHSHADKKMLGFRKHILTLTRQLENMRDGNIRPIQEQFYSCRVCQRPIFDDFFVCCSIACQDQLKCIKTGCDQPPDRSHRRGTKGWFTRYCYEHSKDHSEVFDQKVTYEMMPNGKWKMA